MPKFLIIYLLLCCYSCKTTKTTTKENISIILDKIENLKVSQNLKSELSNITHDERIETITIVNNDTTKTIKIISTNKNNMTKTESNIIELEQQNKTQNINKIDKTEKIKKSISNTIIIIIMIALSIICTLLFFRKFFNIF